MSRLRIRFFGSPDIALQGASSTDLRSAKACALLAYLAVESDQAHRRGKLAGLLWPDYAETSARASLRRALADLRQAIGDHQAAPPHLLITGDTIQFNAASDAWVDVAVFEALLGERPLAGSAALATIEELKCAADLYRGPFLEGFSVPDSAAFEEWVVLTREQLHRLERLALHHLAQAHQSCGEYDQALPYAWRQVEMDPWQEDAHRQVMQILALSGQRGAALAQYEVCRQLLEADLDAMPSEQTQALAELLRRGDWPPAAPPVEGHRESKITGECPYRGLAAFGEADTPFFFGRETTTERLSAAVERSRSVTMVVGASGSGKSSLVFAGLLPRLEAIGQWLNVPLRPGGQPFHALAAALLPWLDPYASETERLITTGKLAQALANDELTLRSVADRAIAKHRHATRLLLIVDQFEEIYTLCSDPLTRERFIDVLFEASGMAHVGAPACPALLVTLRADFMAQALAHRSLADALQDRALMLGPMTRDELRAAIERPAIKQGAAWQPGLVDRILVDVGEAPGNLPLLEFALTLLWEAQQDGWLTHQAYEAIGQVQGALARYAEEVFAALDEVNKVRAQRVFVQLVRPGEGTEDTRRVAKRDEIGEENWVLARHLADRRLVVMDREVSSGDEVAEVAHEALIQRWQRMQSWMAADHSFRVWQEGLRSALRQWETSGRDEGALLAGTPLSGAENWLADRGQELSSVEREFIRTGVAQRELHERERDAQRQRERAAERRDRRLLAALAAVLAVAAVVALGLSAYSLSQRRQALQAYSLGVAANARRALDDRDNVTGLLLALAATRGANPPGEAHRVLIDAAFAPGPRWRSEIATLFPGTTGPATALAIGPDGRTALAGLAGGAILLWDVASKRELRRLEGHTAKVNEVTFGHGGDTALSGGDDGEVILWNLATGKEIRRLRGHSGAVRTVAISPDGHTAVSGGYAGHVLMEPGELILWDLATGQELRRFAGHKAAVVAARFAPDGATLVASSGDAQQFSDSLPGATGEKEGQGLVAIDLLVWDLATGQVRQRFAGLEDDAYSLAVSADGTQALGGSFYNSVAVLWDLGSGEQLRTLKGHTEGVSAVALSADGRRALSGSYDDSLMLWDLKSGQPVARLDVRAGDILAIALSPDGRRALSSGRDGGIVLWDLVDAMEIQRLAGHQDMVWDVALTPNGEQALSSSGAASPNVPVKDASIRLWDLKTGVQKTAAGLPVDVIFQVAVSPDSRTALVATNEPFLRVWDLPSWQEVGRLEGHAAPVTGVEFSPDGKRALSISVDGTLILWDVSERRVVYRLDGHGPGLWSLAISPDGQRALSDSGDSSMILWDLSTGAELRSFSRDDPATEPGSTGMAFLPNGHTAVSSEQDGVLIEWDMETGNEVRRLGQHPSLRTRVVVSPDGRMAATSGMDGTLMLWDLHTGELVRRSTGHGIIFDLVLGHDGRSVLAGSSDTSIFHWRLSNPSMNELQEWIRGNRYVRPPTCEEQKLYGIVTRPGERCTAPGSLD